MGEFITKCCGEMYVIVTLPKDRYVGLCTGCGERVADTDVVDSDPDCWCNTLGWVTKYSLINKKGDKVKATVELIITAGSMKIPLADRMNAPAGQMFLPIK